MSSAKEPVTRRFGNGLTVLIKEDKSHPVVSLQYWVGTGSMNEGHWQGSGLSHLLEHLVFKGTEHYSCLLYTSDAADDLLCVDLGWCRIIKKNNIVCIYPLINTFKKYR